MPTVPAMLPPPSLPPPDLPPDLLALSPPPPSTPLAERLRAASTAWRLITTDEFVLSVVERGLYLPLRSRRALAAAARRPAPPTYRGPPHVTAALAEQLTTWLAQGVIELARRRPAAPGVARLPFLFALLFPVPKSDGSLRWCHDLRFLNTALRVPKVRFEGLQATRQLLRRGDFMTSIDLKSAYSHVLIAPAHRQLLQFSALGQNYQFRAMPFGVSSAPATFTRLMRSVVRWLRARAIRISIYLDDMLIAASSAVECAAHTRQAIGLLQRLGFVINSTKSVLIPTQSIRHLGVLFDTRRWRLTLPFDKTKAIVKDARRVLRLHEAGRLTVRQVAGLAGKLAAATAPIPQARFRLRSIQRLVAFGLRLYGHRRAWSPAATVSLSRTALRDVTWAATATAVRRANGAPLRPPQPQAIITTDASLSGWGATLVVVDEAHQHRKPILASGRWSAAWAATASSNLREATAVTRAFASFRRRLARVTSILVRSDNTTTVAALNKFGSRARSIGLALEPVLRLVMRRRISLRALHVPGVTNVLADRLSRLADFGPPVSASTASALTTSPTLTSIRAADRQSTSSSISSHPTTGPSTTPTAAPSVGAAFRATSPQTDFELAASAISSIETRFGAFTIDLFASDTNRKVSSLAPLAQRSSATVSMANAFACHWGALGQCLIVPPINLISRVVSKVVDDRASAILVVPLWPSAIWFSAAASLARGALILPRDSLLLPPQLLASASQSPRPRAGHRDRSIVTQQPWLSRRVPRLIAFQL